MHFIDKTRNKEFSILANFIAKMFNCELIDNEFIKPVDCPGCEKHYQMSCKIVPEYLRKCDLKLENRSFVMIEKYFPLAERIRNLAIYEDDVWVISYPKCGTTWCQEMVWLLNNNLDFEKAKKIEQIDRFPFLE